jgi:predicted oxidoreductase
MGFAHGENQENHYTITYLSQLILRIFPIVDSFVTLRVITSYREAANHFLAKSKIYRKFTMSGIEPQSDAAARTAWQ